MAVVVIAVVALAAVRESAHRRKLVRKLGRLPADR
jgi:hypothetical protein